MAREEDTVKPNLGNVCTYIASPDNESQDRNRDHKNYLGVFHLKSIT